MKPNQSQVPSTQLTPVALLSQFDSVATPGDVILVYRVGDCTQSIRVHADQSATIWLNRLPLQVASLLLQEVAKQCAAK